MHEADQWKAQQLQVHSWLTWKTFNLGLGLLCSLMTASLGRLDHDINSPGVLWRLALITESCPFDSIVPPPSPFHPDREMSFWDASKFLSAPSPLKKKMLYLKWGCAQFTKDWTQHVFFKATTSFLRLLHKLGKRCSCFNESTQWWIFKATY